MVKGPFMASTPSPLMGVALVQNGKLRIDRITLVPCTSASASSDRPPPTLSFPIVLVGRVFCKKGCDADGDTWDECLSECDEICYKDPVLKDQKWSAYIDRSPGSVSYSEECFHACVAGCGYKFEIPSNQINQVNSRSPKLPIEEKPAAPPTLEPRPPCKSFPTNQEIPSTSA